MRRASLAWVLWGATFVTACGGTVLGGTSDGGSHGGSGSGSGEGVPGGSGTGSGGGTSSGSGSGTTVPPPPNVLSKVDLLFDIDNSASMGDKQSLLIQAIPEVVTRLVTPRCIDTSGNSTGANADPTTGLCTTGTPEFKPVNDLHIGVVTSSLGSRLGVASATTPISYICDPSDSVTSQAGTMVSAFNDDKGHLINRTGPYGSGPAVANAVLPEGGGFLYWYPTTNAGAPVTPPAGNYTNATTLIGDFAELASGAGESGCGIESQLESWYRFLVQPDPYLMLVNDNGSGGLGAASWSGVDTTIIQQRHDFLRPDSVVVVVVLSDENDSEIDVRSYQGSGYLFLSETYTPPRATSACASNPDDAACQPCASGSTDPSCQVNGGVYNDGDDWGFNLNLRHVHMPQKYGLNPQFPLSRYVNGLTSSSVPNRIGEYPTATSSYTGTNNCTNPLFAASLPTAADVPDSMSSTPSEVGTSLCNLPVGSARTAGDIYFAHIGGVPFQLLQSTPGDGTCAVGTAAADCPQKNALTPADWVKVLGTGPAAYTGSGTMSYDYTGIDPHMIESMTPRNVSGLPNSLPTPTSSPAASTLSGPGFGTGSDPVRPDLINGREWTTNTGTHALPVDREYACIFQLPVADQRDCATLSAGTIEGNSCECIPGGSWASGGAASATGNTSDEVSPLCGLASTDGSTKSAVSDYTVQTYAKAYPTTRELMLANMLGSRGVISSMCPIHTVDNSLGTDPLYGYRPAMDVLVNRLKAALPAE